MALICLFCLGLGLILLRCIMAIFLDPTGKTTYGIGICGRCSRKFSLDDLYDDPNTPGLKVCKDDRDEYDPYRLAPRPPDKIALRFTRPDTPIPVTGDEADYESALFGIRGADGDSSNIRVTTDGDRRQILPPTSGDFD